MARVQFSAAASDMSSTSSQNGCGAHAASYPMGIRSCFPRD